MARSQACPQLARQEWRHAADPVARGRTVGAATLQNARRAYWGNEEALAAIADEEAEWGANRIRLPRDSGLIKADVLDIAPRAIGGRTDDDDKWIQLMDAKQGAMLIGEFPAVDIKVTGEDLIEEIRAKTSGLLDNISSIASHRVGKLQETLLILMERIEGLGASLGVDSSTEQTFEDCTQMIRTLEEATRVLCRDASATKECLDTIVMIRSIGMQLDMLRTDAAAGIYTEVSVPHAS